MLYEVNLSIVSTCNANCAFCPRNEYESKIKFMPMPLLQLIVDQISIPEFRNKHDLKMITVGENGEPTLHPKLIEILRYLKRLELPVALYTNFAAFKPLDMSAIFDEDLVFHVHTNVDGYTPESYRLMKNLDYHKVTTNIKDFLRQRKARGKHIPLNLHIITAENYFKAVYKHFGEWPNKFPKDVVIEYIILEAESIKKYWQQYLTEGQDTICIDNILMWAERNHTEKIEGDFQCYNLGRVLHSAFIAPSGDWYICCFDPGNELVLGNLYQDPIDDIFESDKRKKLIEMLYNKEFDEIGPPCNRVDCCQVVSPY